MYGWRGRIGAVIPSNNTVLEPELYRLLPDGMSAHFSRILGRGSGDAQIAAMVESGDRAVDELAAAAVDVVVYACLSTSLVKGRGWDESFSAQVNAHTGLPCVTAAAATIAGLRHVGARRVALGTPYPDHLHERLPAFFGASGIEVVSSHNLGIADILEVCRREPREAYALGRRVWREGAEALCLVATDFRTIEAIGPLERDLGVPVVTTNQALLWSALRSLGVGARITGYGQLLAEGDA